MTLALDKKQLWKDIEREERAKNREKIKLLEMKIRHAMKLRKSAHPKVKVYCQNERAKARARAHALKFRMREEAKELARLMRIAASARCVTRRKRQSVKIQRLRAELAAERKFQKDMRRIASQNRARKPGLARAAAGPRQESDEEVRGNIPSELIPLFNRVRRGIKGGPRMSRTDAFMQYVHDHPREQYAAVEDATDALIRDLERQQRAGRDVRRVRRAWR